MVLFSLRKKYSTPVILENIRRKCEQKYEIYINVHPVWLMFYIRYSVRSGVYINEDMH